MTSTDLDTASLESRTATFRALSDPIRLSILDQLNRGQRYVCELRKAPGVAPNLLSHHVRILRDAGQVESSHRGRWIEYRFPGAAAAAIAAALPGSLVEEMSG